MKTHQPFHAIPKGTCDASRCKYIYVARNPRDVVVSYYNFDCKMAPLTGYSGPFEFFADMFIKGAGEERTFDIFHDVVLCQCVNVCVLCLFSVYWGSWAEHVVGWWNHRDDNNVLFLKYEDLKKVCGFKLITAFQKWKTSTFATKCFLNLFSSAPEWLALHFERNVTPGIGQLCFPCKLNKLVTLLPGTSPEYNRIEFF